jgi:hypothetical protein
VQREADAACVFACVQRVYCLVLLYSIYSMLCSMLCAAALWTMQRQQLNMVWLPLQDERDGFRREEDNRSGLSARQRARLADLSLLLDVVLKAGSSALKTEFVVCGLLTQLQQCIGRNWSKVRPGAEAGRAALCCVVPMTAGQMQQPGMPCHQLTSALWH